MAFTEIERGVFSGREAIKDCVRIRSNGTTATVMISNDIYKAIGSPILLKLLLGSGEHSGKIAMVPRNMPSTGTYKPHVNNGKGLAHFSISPKKLGIIGKIEAVVLPHEITDDGLVVDLRPALTARPHLVAAE